MLCCDEIWERRREKNNCKVCISIATSLVWDLGMHKASQGVCGSATLRRNAPCVWLVRTLHKQRIPSAL